jgi:GTPase SAR1 family protein
MSSSDSCLDSTGPAFTDAIIEWYWEFGAKRQGAFALSPTWLDTVYQRRDTLSAIKESASHPKASVGLWGPSQSGKSTLISQFADHRADQNGKGGALHWDIPAVFSSRRDLPPDVVVFNPHNMGSDASGCVSRFVLGSDASVKFHDCPVEVRLLTPAQLLHAIAAGYTTECKTGEDRPWTPETLEELADSYAANSTSTAVDRKAFEHLHDVLNVVDLLIGAKNPRFTGLDSNGKWKSSLRGRILQTKGLLVNFHNTDNFACALLWHGMSPLNRLYERLTHFRAQLPRGPMYCGMNIAATLVNIDAYRIFKSDSQDDSLSAVRRIKETIRHLTWEKREDKIVVGAQFSNRLLERDDDFGLFQGLVCELIIPLRERQREDDGERSVPPLSFLDKAELVDFPGVPLRDVNIKDMRLDLEHLADVDDPRLLTEVLKRGKVASLINDYSRSLALDAFVLLVRAGQFAAKPTQLDASIRAWWTFFDPSYDVYDRGGRKPPLPLFLNLTFFGAIVDKVAEGAAALGLRPLLEMVKQLGPLADSRVCTLLATTYPQFEAGKVHLKDDREAVEKAVQEILADHSFGPRFATPASRDSLFKMALEQDGGVGHLFDVLAGTVSSSARQHLLNDRRAEALKDVQSHIVGLGAGSESDRRRQDIEAVQQSLHAALEEKRHDRSVRDPAAWLSYRLRLLFDVNPETLDPLPAAASGIRNYEAYIEAQVGKWIDSKESITNLHELGLDDPALKVRVLGYLAERIRPGDIAIWMKDELPRARSKEDADELRRVLAIVLSNALNRCDGQAPVHPPLDGPNGVVATICRWAESEEQGGSPDWGNSPHYASIIEPALALLDDLAKGRNAVRPPQPGDSQIRALLERFKGLPAAEASKP